MGVSQTALLTEYLRVVWDSPVSFRMMRCTLSASGDFPSQSQMILCENWAVKGPFAALRTMIFWKAESGCGANHLSRRMPSVDAFRRVGVRPFLKI